MTEHGKQAWADSYTLLCERCGYVIEGLAKDSVCPECAKPIAESLPGRRPGTPWQQRRGLRPMLHTWWLVVRHPLRTLDTMAVMPPRIRLLLVLAALPLGILSSATILLILEAERPRSNGGTIAWHPGGLLDGLLLSIVAGVVLTPFVVVILRVLTWIEARGLVLFSAQNSTRIHPELAHTITRHGAVAWLVCGLGAALATPLAWSMEQGWRQALGPPQWWAFMLAVAGVVLALAGFLYFEFFAWLGLRRCKFANRSRS